MTRLLRWPEIEFTPSVLEQSDNVVKHAHGDKPDVDTSGPKVIIKEGSVPEAHILWSFAPNPHAHEKPRECYSLTTHGVRNAYWMAFTGDTAKDKADL